MVATVNLPVIDRRFVLHRKAHGQEGTVRGPAGLNWAERITENTVGAAHLVKRIVM